MSAETTRRVVLMGHATADFPDGDDHERPLVERGRKDAPRVGRWIADSGSSPDRALYPNADDRPRVVGGAPGQVAVPSGGQRTSFQPLLRTVVATV
ncbi:hypothetical protein [Streptomyces sp. NPDC001091]